MNSAARALGRPMTRAKPHLGEEEEEEDEELSL